jgi:hypothetical protein
MLSKVLGGAIAVCLLVIWFLWNQNGNLQENIGKAKAAVAQAAQTNDNNLVTITDLGDRLDTCVTDRQVDEAANVAVVSSLNADILRLEEEGFGIRIETEEIFREPSCEELGSLDVAAICPALATSMRDSADSLNRGGDPGSSGSGSDSTP